MLEIFGYFFSNGISDQSMQALLTHPVPLIKNSCGLNPDLMLDPEMNKKKYYRRNYFENVHVQCALCVANLYVLIL